VTEQSGPIDLYDFIIVGAGSAGSVLAARLSEDPSARILLLEAGGPDRPENVAIPALWYTLLRSGIDWDYQTIEQPGLLGRRTHEPRGKLPGGSSNLYIMMHVRGHPADFDNWAYNGCPGWSFLDCLPYFQKLEDHEDPAGPLAGKGGPIRVASARRHQPNTTSQVFIDACAELGFPTTDDFNGESLEGAGWHHLNIKNGQRHGTFAAYLEPALARPNLTLATGCHATRLVFENRRCAGVDSIRDGRMHHARCSREVIVCAGAIESPKLLMLSGIGPAEQLRAFDIPVLVDSPGVGENFHNHILTGVICESSRPVPPPNLNLSESALFCRSSPGWPAPDLQLGFVHVPFDIIIGQRHPNAFSILPGVVRPLSRGWVRLSSPDPLEKPLVNPNYLAAESDAIRLAQAVALARKIFATRAFAPWVKQELMPGPTVRNDDLFDWVRQSADSYHHQAGSCRMGIDALAVVDPALRVHGVENLRVADASVMPAVPSGNCHAAILMIAEKLADMIKTEYQMAGWPSSTRSA
jgi:choline dehydrogenase